MNLIDSSYRNETDNIEGETPTWKRFGNSTQARLQNEGRSVNLFQTFNAFVILSVS